MTQFKAYVIMTNYHSEGWKLSETVDDFQDAVRVREALMGFGNSEVVIFRPVEIVYREGDAEVLEATT